MFFKDWLAVPPPNFNFQTLWNTYAIAEKDRNHDNPKRPKTIQNSLKQVYPKTKPFVTIPMVQGYAASFRESTIPETHSSHPRMDGWNTIVSFLVFSGAMLVLGRVYPTDLLLRTGASRCALLGWEKARPGDMNVALEMLKVPGFQTTRSHEMKTRRFFWVQIKVGATLTYRYLIHIIYICTKTIIRF